MAQNHQQGFNVGQASFGHQTRKKNFCTAGVTREAICNIERLETVSGQVGVMFALPATGPFSEIHMSEACSEKVVSASCLSVALIDEPARPEDERRPFVHKFQTKRAKYVFDVNTRRIMKVSDAVWDVLDDYGTAGDEQIIAKLEERYDQDSIRQALEQVRSAQEDGLLLAHRPDEVIPPSKKQIARRLENQREQLILGVTENCNFRCRYCVYGSNDPQQRPHSDKSMPWEIARAAIDAFLSQSKLSESRAMSFYGGEPLLNLPLIRQCVSYAQETFPDLPVNFSMTTNGSLLQDAAGDFLAEHEFIITVSLDGPQDIHDRNRLTQGGLPTWGQVMANLRAFLARHPQYKTNGRLRFNAVATPAANLCQAQEFFGGCDVFTDQMGMQVSPEKQTQETGALRAEDPLAVSARKLQREFLERLSNGEFGDRHSCRSYWMQASLFQRPYLLFHKRKYVRPHLPTTLVYLNTCLPGQRRTFVDVAGNYYPCERVRLTDDQRIGNCFDGLSMDKVAGLLEQWNLSAGGQCRQCWCVSNCNVGCFATVGDNGGLTAEAMAGACSVQRRELHDLLVSYCSILEENPSAFDYAAQMMIQ